MDFAQLQLKKFGWESGQGLGKDGNGLKEPLKASLKFDKSGLGYEENSFGLEWWDRMYNNTIDCLTVSKKGEQVKLIRREKLRESEKSHLSSCSERSRKYYEGSDLVIKKLSHHSLIACGHKLDHEPPLDKKTRESHDRDPSYMIKGGSHSKLKRLRKQEKRHLKESIR